MVVQQWFVILVFSQEKRSACPATLPSWEHLDDCGQESLRRNGVAIIANKRVWNAVLGCNLKNDVIISAHFQGKPFNITVIQVYATTSNAEEAEVEWFCEDLQDLLELTPKKDVLFTKETGLQKFSSVQSLSHVWLFPTPWTAAFQAPPSMGFSRQEYWSGVSSPSPSL